MFPLTPELVAFLADDSGRQALAGLTAADLDPRAELSTLDRLRKTFSPDQAAALLDQARLHRRAGDKFPQPQHLLFTDDGLQQASTRAVARYRASLLAEALTDQEQPALVADLGCGIGADTVALAEAGLHVLAVERDPVRARIAAHNIAELGLEDRVQVVEGDWTSLPLTPTLSQRERESEADSGPLSPRERDGVRASDPLSPRERDGVRVSGPLSRWERDGVRASGPLSRWERDGVRVSAAFIDPSRRTQDRRIFDPEAMDPPLSAILPLTEHLDAVAVKTLPGIADADIPPSAEVEFISERGQMKEALLRFGSLKAGAARRATLLPGPHHLDSNAPLAALSAAEPLGWLLEPDPAVIRATLVQHLATALNAQQIDPSIAYLTCDRQVDTPFARGWEVLRHGPFNLKILNRWLREMGAGEVVVKKRGSPIDPDEFRRRLKTTAGGQPLTVFLTRVLDRPWMIVGAER